MVIRWQKHDERTDFGLFKVGDVIDTAERRIPAEVVSAWIRDGYAVEERPVPVVKAAPAREKQKKSGRSGKGE